MAMIEKMSISGVRSYPPEDQKGKAVIQFFTPLTLIVGQNGTGKTSIIECLNYVVTNSLPPGCKNSAFIHDPSIARQQEVKGQVKLKFVDVTGNTIVGTRSMVSTQKKIETKSLDGVINKQPRDGGEPQSISSRCTDFTKEMISRLGVSKAVLENVIFCHQEDANWPLSEGKILKKKFDDIFAATRYIKALESIRNLRKDQGSEVKTFNAELIHLKQNKEKAEEIAQDKIKAENQKLITEEQIRKINDKLKPIQEKLSALDTMSFEVMNLRGKIGNLESLKTEKKRNASSLEGRIEKKFEGSIEELKELLAQSDEILATKQDDLKKLEVKINRMGIEYDRLTKNKNDLGIEQGRLQSEAEVHQQQIEDRDSLIKQLAEQYDIEGFDKSGYTLDEAKLFKMKIKDTYRNLVTYGKSKREIFEKDLKAVEEKIKNIEKKINTQDSIISQKQGLVKTNETKLKEVNNALSHLAASEGRLQSLENDIKKTKSRNEELKKEMNVSVVKNEIDNLLLEKNDDEKQLGKLREEESKMIQQSEAQTTLDILRKQKDEMEENVEKILRKHQCSLDKIFDTRPSRDQLKCQLSDVIGNKQNKLNAIVEKQQRKSEAIAGKMATKKSIMSEKEKSDSELSKSKKKLHEVCQENDYNRMKEQIQQSVEKNQNTLVELGAFERIYQKYIVQLQEEADDGCPLCHRSFDSKRAVRNLIEELQEKLGHVPEKRNLVQSKLDKDKKLNGKLMDLIPVKSRYDSLSDEVPKLTLQLQKITEEIETEQEKLKEVNRKRTEIEEEKNMCEVMKTDIHKLDDYIIKLKDFDKDITIQSRKIHGVKPGHTMQSLRNLVEEKQSKVDTLSRKINKKQGQIVEFQRQCSLREGEINELMSEKLKLASEIQKRLQLETQQTDLVSTNQAYQRDIKDASRQLEPLRSSLTEAEEEKADIEREKKSNEEEIRSKLEKIKQSGNKVVEKQDAIERYVNDGKENDLNNNAEKLKDTEERLDTKRRDINNLKKEKTSIQDQINNQDLHKRELDDNMVLITTKKEIQDINLQISNFMDELSKFGNCNDLGEQRNNLQEKLDKYRKDIATHEGRLSGFEEEVKRCKRDLSSSLYADAETKHSDKIIQLRTTELANQDLEKYYKALDRAIMKYHGLKLAEINKIIKEYWIKTYKGNDIDTIEIVAESDDDGASKARRSYNYRVCMIKQGASLDMRSRCSAGQKVLASIIIRLALAETFCLNCGILALDEPTTNLDEENVNSLANSLREIIEMRMQQKNFQLLVITHDEYFVQELGQSDFVEYYFRVYKDNDGHSRIHKRRIAEKE